MHPAIMRQLAADRIREIRLEAEDKRRARRARRHAPPPRPRLPGSEAVSYDDPRRDAGQRATMHEQPSAPPLPVLAGSPPDSGDAITRREALEHCH
jgi:hypothetical protein